MPGRRSPILDNLIRQANQTANRKPDSVELLALMVRLATEDGADPYLILGVLAEGAAQTIARHVPQERQPDAVSTLLAVLTERLRSHGL